MASALDTFRRAPFGVSDALRHAQGQALAAFGLGPSERDYRIVASGRFWRLRDYGGSVTRPTLLIVAAPIKKPYIWDLSPSASAIRHCLRQGLHVRLLEWLPASATTGNNGLAEYVEAIAECVAASSRRHATVRPFLAGHSLGGTLAAISGTLAPGSIQGLMLLGAPLSFQPASSPFRDALVSLVPSGFSDSILYPGSLLSHVSALASPDTFVWARLADAALSLGDAQTLELHARVEHWALDEAALPGRLVHQLIEWLYRENRLCRGELMIGDRAADPRNMSAPTLVVVTATDDIAPKASVEPFVEAMPAKDVRVIEYAGDVGVCLQHLGILIGQKAHARIWPKITAWIEAHA
ncbi:MAG: alpha/beta hydrolase [Proteobacteria bacterium]|nr:alpha/beta hydrolase [Pseudomonadota bacterium]